MRVTFVLLLIIFLQLSQALRLYLCLCPSYQDKVITDGTNECSECEPMPRQHRYRKLGLRVSLITGAARHKWRIRRKRNLRPVENVSLTMYRLTDHYYARRWLPLEGCIDIPLQDRECFPTKCDDLYDRRVILHKGNESYVDPMPYSRICPAHKCDSTTIRIVMLNYTLTSRSMNARDDIIQQRVGSCYFYYSKEKVLNVTGGILSTFYSDPKMFGRNVYELRPEMFYINDYERMEDYVLDLTSCHVYPCESTLELSQDPTIFEMLNYEFSFNDKSGTLLVCLSSNNLVLCMDRSRNRVERSDDEGAESLVRNPTS